MESKDNFDERLADRLEMANRYPRVLRQLKALQEMQKELLRATEELLESADKGLGLVTNGPDSDEMRSIVEHLLVELRNGAHVTTDTIKESYPHLEDHTVWYIKRKLSEAPNIEKMRDPKDRRYNFLAYRRPQ